MHTPLHTQHSPLERNSELKDLLGFEHYEGSPLSHSLEAHNNTIVSPSMDLEPTLGFNWESVSGVVHQPNSENGSGNGSENIRRAASDIRIKRALPRKYDHDLHSERWQYKHEHRTARGQFNTTSRLNNRNPSIFTRKQPCQRDPTHQDFITEFKRDCAWWGWSLLCPSQLGKIQVISFLFYVTE